MGSCPAYKAQILVSLLKLPPLLCGCEPDFHFKLQHMFDPSSAFVNKIDSDTLMAARSQPNDNWGSVGNGAKHGEKHVGGGSGM